MKKLMYCIFTTIFLWCNVTSASTSIRVQGQTTNTPSAAATNYTGLTGGDNEIFDTTESNHYETISAPGTFSGLFVAQNVVSGALATYTYIVRKNGADTTLTCAITGAVATTCTDATHNFTVTANDTIDMSITPSGTSPATISPSWALKFDGTTAGESNIMAQSVGTTFNNNVRYFSPFTGTNGATESNNELVFPFSGTVKNFYISLKTAPGSGKTQIVMVRKNEADTTLTCTVADTNTACNDTTHSFTVAAADRLTLKISGTGTPANTSHSFGITFLADTAGNSFTTSISQTNFSTSATQYSQISVGSSTPITTEANRDQVALASTIKNIYVLQTPAPAAGKSYAFTLRKNAVDTALTCTVSGTGTTCNAATDITVVDGDLLDIKSIPSGTPTAGAAIISLGINIAEAGGAARRRVHEIA